MRRRVGPACGQVTLTRHSRKAAALKLAGAEHMIGAEEQDTAQEVSCLTGGKGARVIFHARSQLYRKGQSDELIAG
jgi:NADPH:quinone reductase-like Zn-dependent oxidoreductase